jgi:hypothetical protein
MLAICLLLATVTATEVFMSNGTVQVPITQLATIHTESAPVVQDRIHLDVQDPVTSQRVAGPFIWQQLVPALQRVDNQTLLLVPYMLVDDIVGARFEKDSFVLGIRHDNVTDFLRMRFTHDDDESLVAVEAVVGVIVGVTVVLACVLIAKSQSV